MHATEQPTYTTPDFRVYAPFRAKDRHGVEILMQRCEELVEGRWEAFITIVRDNEA